MADNEIRLNVTAVESEPLNVCVEQVPMNPVNVENTYKGVDYNLLKNRPSIEGQTIEGDNTVEELIGFDKEYVDDAILTTNAKIDDVEQDLSDRIDAISVSTDVYTKQEIDNKITVIEADIDANAAAIAGKQDKLTAGEGISIAGNVISATGGSLPDNVYTQDNLVGGTDIELVKEVVGGGQIDDDTILMLHLDGNAEDSSPHKGELSLGDASGWTYGEGKFGQMALSGDAISITDDNNTLFNAVDKVTVDYTTFFSANATDTASVRVVMLGGADVYVYAYYYSGKVLEAYINGASTTIDTTNIELEQFLQISYEISEGKVVVFINGNPVITKEDSNIKMGTGISFIQAKPPTSGNAGIDEVRVSKCLRYNGQAFTPPESAYGPATETGRTLVSYVGGSSEGVYTEENLIGGKGVEIVPEATGGGKDEHTIALWHLDTDVIDSVNGIALQYPSTLSATSGIFGGCVRNYSNAQANDISVLGLTSSDSWTMDFWLKYQTYQSSGIGDYGLGATYSGTSNALTIGFYRYELRLSGIGWGDARNTTIKDFAGITTPWYHMAIQYDATNKIGYVFIDGEPVYEGAVTIADGSLFSHMALQNGPGVLFDEIRISNTLRYSGKFTPPTEPYSEPVLTGRSTIEAEGKADTDLGNIPANYDYVVESYNDGTNWYRVYKSGWIEQGGKATYTATRDKISNVSFLKPFSNSNIYVSGSGISASRGGSSSWIPCFGVTDITSTGFLARVYGLTEVDMGNGFTWYARGQGA